MGGLPSFLLWWMSLLLRTEKYDSFFQNKYLPCSEVNNVVLTSWFSSLMIILIMKCFIPLLHHHCMEDFIFYHLVAVYQKSSKRSREHECCVPACRGCTQEDDSQGWQSVKGSVVWLRWVQCQMEYSREGGLWITGRRQRWSDSTGQI